MRSINADNLSQKKMRKFDPRRIKTPEPIAKSLLITSGRRSLCDCLCEISCAKFRANPSTGTSWQMAVTNFIFLYPVCKQWVRKRAHWYKGDMIMVCHLFTPQIFFYFRCASRCMSPFIAVFRSGSFHITTY